MVCISISEHLLDALTGYTLLSSAEHHAGVHLRKAASALPIQLTTV
jgi:hypothetical protein